MVSIGHIHTNDVAMCQSPRENQKHEVQNNVLPTGYCTASLSLKFVKNTKDKIPDFSPCFLSLPIQATTVTSVLARNVQHFAQQLI